MCRHNIGVLAFVYQPHDHTFMFIGRPHNDIPSNQHAEQTSWKNPFLIILPLFFSSVHQIYFCRVHAVITAVTFVHFQFSGGREKGRKCEIGRARARASPQACLKKFKSLMSCYCGRRRIQWYALTMLRTRNQLIAVCWTSSQCSFVWGWFWHKNRALLSKKEGERERRREAKGGEGRRREAKRERESGRDRARDSDSR